MTLTKKQRNKIYKAALATIDEYGYLCGALWYEVNKLHKFRLYSSFMDDAMFLLDEFMLFRPTQEELDNWYGEDERTLMLTWFDDEDTEQIERKIVLDFCILMSEQ